MSKFASEMHQIQCGTKKFRLSKEILLKLPHFESTQADWQNLSVIELDRDPKFFAAMVKHLQGYPLYGKDIARARLELAHFGAELPTSAVTIDSASKDVTFAVSYIEDETIDGGPQVKGLISIKQQTLDLLPVLALVLTATTSRHDAAPDAVPHIVCRSQLPKALLELQRSMHPNYALDLHHWHLLHGHGLPYWHHISLGQFSFFQSKVFGFP